MSRHSKWSKIKGPKGVADKKKGVLFSKLTRAITLTAREGGDPGANFKLRMAIDTAKAAEMPKDNIERAIAKGSGADKDGAQLIQETYEGFGPGGVAFMVEVVTDNKNRAYQELKHTFAEHQGNLGGSGSVAWMFQKRGVIRLAVSSSQSSVHSDFELKLIDAGAEDIVPEDEGLTVYTKPEALKSTEEKLRAAGLTPEYAGLAWVPKEKITAPPAAQNQFAALEDALDEMEDVSEYYTNATI
ncbi:YebC/PmpR family DNA-binding transcriptional regulator [Candidatus Uhrbacteria bacterium]|nr:YebC/PmpR family DNA-binding transcriptional regulator [Candidatus Uhrbacteria bacterium]